MGERYTIISPNTFNHRLLLHDYLPLRNKSAPWASRVITDQSLQTEAKSVQITHSFVSNNGDRRLVLSLDVPHPAPFPIFSWPPRQQWQGDTAFVARVQCLSSVEHDWNNEADGVEGTWTTVQYPIIVFLFRCWGSFFMFVQRTRHKHQGSNTSNLWYP